MSGGLLPLDSVVPGGLRAQLHVQFAALPHAAASAMADEMADLTLLAVTEAVGALDRVAARASNHGAQMCVLSAGVSTTVAVLQNVSDALVAYAEAQGAQVFSATVTVGGGQG